MGFFRGEGARVYPPLFFYDRIDGGVTPFQTAKKYFWETLGTEGAFGDLYIIPLPRPCKNFNAKPRVEAMLCKLAFIY